LHRGVSATPNLPIFGLRSETQLRLLAFATV
jgi:hypothetical protein